jgi:hypothetical protein
VLIGKTGEGAVEYDNLDNNFILPSSGVIFTRNVSC